MRDNRIGSRRAKGDTKVAFSLRELIKIEAPTLLAYDDPGLAAGTVTVAAIRRALKLLRR